jgi:FtsP/CotA-like multicopper oxidase with cupredoxin domain
MRFKFVKRCSQLIMLLAVFVLMAGTSFAKNYYLKAEAFDKIMPNGSIIKMWGFSRTDSSGVELEPVSVPGPVLNVPQSQTVLKVRVDNTLTVPVSLVIQGQSMPTKNNGTLAAPVMFDDGTGRMRVMSFTHETPPGTKRWYKWSNFKPGTYIYHSGTHQQVQVQMGLYGAAKRDAGPGKTAYKDKDDNDIKYKNEVIILFSEIDPFLHAAVADGTYGTTGPTSTIDYKPTYYLINGDPFSSGSPLSLSVGAYNKKTLLRLLNAGLKTHVPVIQDTYMEVIAQNGNVYPYSKEQYSLRLPALNTRDACITPKGKIKITRVDNTGGDLVVVAKSDAGGAAALQITDIDGLITPIDMNWNANSNRWRKRVTGVGTIGSVTVSGLCERYAVYDRRLHLTNDFDNATTLTDHTPGGMLIYLDLEGSNTAAP